MICIVRAKNGYLLKVKYPDEDEQLIVVEENENDEDEQETFLKLVHALKDAVGVTGSKRSSKRFYGIIAPGYDHPDYKGLDFAYWGSYHTVEEAVQGDSSIG